MIKLRNVKRAVVSVNEYLFDLDDVEEDERGNPFYLLLMFGPAVVALALLLFAVIAY